MAAITICSDFGAQKIKSDTVSTVSLSTSHKVKVALNRVKDGKSNQTDPV